MALLMEAMEGLFNCKTLALTDTHSPWGAFWLEKEMDRELLRGVHHGNDVGDRFVPHLLMVSLMPWHEVSYRSRI